MTIIRERDPDVVYESRVERDSRALSIGLGILMLAVIGLLIFFAANHNRPQVLEELTPPAATTPSPTIVPVPQPYAVPVPQTVTQPIPVPVTQPVPYPVPSASPGAGSSGSESRPSRDSGTSNSSGTSSPSGTSNSSSPTDQVGSGVNGDASTSTDTSSTPVTP
jgi:hypothetical protein